MIDLATLTRVITAVAPHSDEATWAKALLAPMAANGINTPRRIAMFIGQCAEESAGFSTLEEDLFYTTPRRLCQIWPTHFATEADAAPYIGEPEMLADLVYAGRLGNHDMDSGDGWRFRGRGLIQITGRWNYTAFAHAVAQSPYEIGAWMLTPPGAAASACWYWASRPAINALTDAWDVVGVTRLINGGETDEARRALLCGAALAAIVTASPPVVEVKAETPGEVEADRLDTLYNPEVEI